MLAFVLLISANIKDTIMHNYGKIFTFIALQSKVYVYVDTFSLKMF